MSTKMRGHPAAKIDRGVHDVVRPAKLVDVVLVQMAFSEELKWLRVMNPSR
jgi:hypothetical protein